MRSAQATAGLMDIRGGLVELARLSEHHQSRRRLDERSRPAGSLAIVAVG